MNKLYSILVSGARVDEAIIYGRKVSNVRITKKMREVISMLVASAETDQALRAFQASAIIRLLDYSDISEDCYMLDPNNTYAYFPAYISFTAQAATNGTATKVAVNNIASGMYPELVINAALAGEDIRILANSSSEIVEPYQPGKLMRFFESFEVVIPKGLQDGDLLLVHALKTPVRQRLDRQRLYSACAKLGMTGRYLLDDSAEIEDLVACLCVWLLEQEAGI